jgi:hypothetical protein
MTTKATPVTIKYNHFFLNIPQLSSTPTGATRVLCITPIGAPKSDTLFSSTDVYGAIGFANPGSEASQRLYACEWTKVHSREIDLKKADRNEYGGSGLYGNPNRVFVTLNGLKEIARGIYNPISMRERIPALQKWIDEVVVPTLLPPANVIDVPIVTAVPTTPTLETVPDSRLAQFPLANWLVGLGTLMEAHGRATQLMGHKMAQMEIGHEEVKWNLVDLGNNIASMAKSTTEILSPEPPLPASPVVGPITSRVQQRKADKQRSPVRLQINSHVTAWSMQDFDPATSTRESSGKNYNEGWNRVWADVLNTTGCDYRVLATTETLKAKKHVNALDVAEADGALDKVLASALRVLIIKEKTTT